MLPSFSPNTAANAYGKIKEKALELDTYPERGRIVPELQRQGIVQYRELMSAPWRMIYKISGHPVVVLSVQDARRILEDLLLQRLLELKHENPLP